MMTTMKIEACCKVNYTLEVFAKRVDGYHALRSIVLPVSLSDTLEFNATDVSLPLIASDTGYPDDLIVKAGYVLAQHCGDAANLTHFNVHVEKRIPAGGGLGGGSADAAATLSALNSLWHLGLSPERLAELGAEVGSDVPALVLAQHYHHAVMMEGRGECVRLCEPSEFVPLSKDIVLVNPGVHSVTRDVFARFDAAPPATGVANNLEPPALALYPEIELVLSDLQAAGAKEVRMSGSGATVFGFTPDAESAANVANLMIAKSHLAWTAKIMV